MPLDPRIIGSGQAQPFNNPFEALAAGRQAQAAQQAQQQAQAEQSQIRQQTIAQNQRQLQTEQRAVESDESYRSIIGNPDLTPEAVGELVRTKTPEKYDAYLTQIDKHAQMASARKKARLEEATATKAFVGGIMDDIAQADYDPLRTELGLKMIEAEEPQFAEQAAQIRQQILDGGGRPAIKALIDQLRPAPKAQPDYTLNPGDTRISGVTNQPVATGAQKPVTPPAAGSFEDYMSADPAKRTAIEAARKGYLQSDDRPRVDVRVGGGRDPRRELTPNAEANVTRQFVKQWTDATKPARDLDRQVSLIDAGMTAARRGDLNAGGQTVLVAFQKILDPTSVVREAEFDRSAAGQSMMNRVRGAVEKLTKGGTALPIGELEKFHALAKEVAAAQIGAYQQGVKTRIGKAADRYNIPQELIFEGLPESAPASAAPAGPKKVGRFVIEAGP